mmetsp:Transcript_24601/g.48946  ORF Transcript_24601/g.48946 Transcript_24601/m.48946 type:complete len:208 (-) Transcript_24601:425-1048(-)
MLVQSLPLTHTLPLFIFLQKLNLGIQIHIFQIPYRSFGWSIESNPQRLESILHLVIFPSPSPKSIGIPIDSFHILFRERDDPPKVFWIIGVSIPYSRNVRGNGGIPCVPIFQIPIGQEIDVVEYEYVVFGGMSRRSLEGVVESDVEEFASVEFPLVVGLFDDVDVVVLDLVLGLEVGEELFHVRCEFGEVFGSLLGGVEVSVGDYDG